jgi:cellobiose-specific phosphotransferase system component IIA
MKHAAILFSCLLASGCGVETASTAATSATIKKQELDQGKQSMERAQEKINQAVQAQQQRAGDGGAKE